VNGISLIAVYSMPAFLPLGLAIVAITKKDWPLGPRRLIGWSLLLSVATWIAYLVAWERDGCWDESDACSTSQISGLYAYLFLIAGVSLILGVSWLLVRRVAERRRSVG
jgi:hypothetical protein